MEVEKMKCDDLRAELTKRNLDTSGKKPELVKRLKEAIQNERCLSPSCDSGKPEKASSVDSSKRKSSDESGSEEDHTNKRTKSSDWAQEDESLERSKSEEGSEGSQSQNDNSNPAITATYYPADDPSYSQSQQSNVDQAQQQQSQQYSDSYNQYYSSQQQASQQQQQQSTQQSQSSSSASTTTSIEYAEPIPNNPIAEEKRKVFVGGLSSSVTEFQIKQILDSYGAIENIQLIRDNITGISKGYAFVLFTNDEPANRLINMQSIEICGKSATLRPLTDKNSIKIFVGGISSLTEDDLREYFSQYCSVLEITLIKDQISQKPKGYGFISLSDRRKGEEIINEGKVQIKGIYVNVGNATKRNNMMMMNGNNNNSNSNMNGMYNNNNNNMNNPNNYFHNMYGILPTGMMIPPSAAGAASGTAAPLLPGVNSGATPAGMYAAAAVPTAGGAAGAAASMMMMNGGYYPYSYSYPYYPYPPPAAGGIPAVPVPPPSSNSDGTNNNAYSGYYGYGTK